MNSSVVLRCGSLPQIQPHLQRTTCHNDRFTSTTSSPRTLHHGQARCHIVAPVLRQARLQLRVVWGFVCLSCKHDTSVSAITALTVKPLSSTARAQTAEDQVKTGTTRKIRRSTRAVKELRPSRWAAPSCAFYFALLPLLCFFCGVLGVVWRLAFSVSDMATNSTRRFACRPASVLLSATGFSMP